MGISRLVVVEPENCDLTRVLKTATHAAAHLVENMEEYSHLAVALQDFHYVVGTTARVGGAQRSEVKDPRETAARVLSMCANNRVALVFGPEDRGLTNAELRYCHTLATIPTVGFSSLNLAHAVMIICYELLTASCEPVERHAPRLASRRELDAMYEHLKETFIKINFINPENPEYWMHSIRRFFSRTGLRARDVKVIRGICRQIDWYTQTRLEMMQERSRE
jgi:tRNA/rRNA methyltransferase